MMKKCRYLLLLVLFIMPIRYVDAAVSANISISTNTTIVGNSGTAVLTIDAGGQHIGQVYGTFSCGALGDRDLQFAEMSNPPTSKTYTINWTAKNVGTYTCSVTGLEVGTVDPVGFNTISVASKKITVVGSNNSGSNNNSNSGGQSSGGGNSQHGGTTADKKEYDSNNELKSLSVDGYELNPSFTKDVLEYKLDVDETVEKINIKAQASSDKAQVSGIGEVNLTPGENTINIRVEAENGNEKVYKILVNVKDLHPIKVMIDGKEYTVVKKNNDIIKKLEYCDEEVIKIDDMDVISYINPNTKVRLVILKDNKNQVGYYIYNERTDKYSKYRAITIGNITLQLLDINKKLKHFKKYQVKVKDDTIDVYKVKKSNKMGLVYGTNVSNNNTGYYVYDSENESLSKYYDEEVNAVNKELLDYKNATMLIIGILSGATIVSIFISIVSVIKRRKRRTFN